MKLKFEMKSLKQLHYCVVKITIQNSIFFPKHLSLFSGFKLNYQKYIVLRKNTLCVISTKNIYFRITKFPVYTPRPEFGNVCISGQELRRTIYPVCTIYTNKMIKFYFKKYIIQNIIFYVGSKIFY